MQKKLLIVTPKCTKEGTQTNSLHTIVGARSTINNTK